MLLAPVLAAGLWAGGVRLSGNVHEVEPGLLYRSAQINGDQLRTTLSRYHIRTVINLRGNGSGRQCYDDEVAVSASLGVQHLDIALSANREPDAPTLALLVTLLRTAPPPVLIHCNGGADRSGLSAAVYEYVVAGNRLNKPPDSYRSSMGIFHSCSVAPGPWIARS